MARSRLEIVIEALNLASDELKQVEKELSGIDDAGESSSKSLGSMAFSFNNVVAAGRTAAQVLGEVVELGERGAVFENMSAQLEMYTGSAYMAAEVTDLMSEATDGALDRFTAAQNASRFYGMELANTAEDAALLADIAVTLGDRTLTAQQRIDNFTLMMANQSKRRLDTYNISIGAVEEEMERLKSTTSSLSDDQVFLQAVLKVGGERLAEMEEAGIKAATGYDQARSSLSDFNTEAGRSINQIFGPLAAGFAKVVGEQADYLHMQNEIKAAIQDNIITQEEYDAILEEQARTGGQGWYQRGIVEGYQLVQAEGMKAAQVSGFMAETTVTSNELSAESLKVLEDAYAGVAEQAQQAVKIFLDFEPSVNTVKQSFGALNTDLVYNQAMTGLSGDATLELARATGQLNESTYSVLEPLEQLNQAQQAGMINAEDYAAAVVEMNRIRIEEGPEAAAAYLEAVLGEIEKTEEASLKTQAWGLEILGVTDALENFPDDYTTLEGWQESFSDAGSSADTAASKVKAVVDWLEKLPEEKTVYVNVVTTGNVGLLSSGAQVSTGSSGNAAGSARVQGGVPTIVGETGRELFIPATDGQIVNNDQLKRMGGGGVQVTNVFYVWGDELARAVDEGMLRAFMQAGMAVR